jgi:hypothetical protein
LLLTGDHKIDNHRCSPRQAGGGSSEKIIAGYGSHKGQLHMRVGIDSARHNKLAAGIDFFESAGLIYIICDFHDLPVSAQHISAPGLLSGYNSSPFDQNTHLNLLVLFIMIFNKAIICAAFVLRIFEIIG